MNRQYDSTSSMWCQEKRWHSVVYQAEPAWENETTVNVTFQALKRWDDSPNACLISLLPTAARPFLCEIVGEKAN